MKSGLEVLALPMSLENEDTFFHIERNTSDSQGSSALNRAHVTRLLPRAGLVSRYKARLLGRAGDVGLRDIFATSLISLLSKKESIFAVPWPPRFPVGNNFAKYPTSSSISCTVGSCGDGAANAYVSVSRRVANVFSAMRTGP